MLQKLLALASLYERLLGWERVTDTERYIGLRAPSGVRLCFQTEPNYVPPVWPRGPDSPLMMIHLEIGVDDVDAGVAWAIDAGATHAEHQPQDHVRVLLDPAGHPFCLFLWQE